MELPGSYFLPPNAKLPSMIHLRTFATARNIFQKLNKKSGVSWSNSGQKEFWDTFFVLSQLSIRDGGKGMANLYSCGPRPVIYTPLSSLISQVIYTEAGGSVFAGCVIGLWLTNDHGLHNFVFPDDDDGDGN